MTVPFFCYLSFCGFFLFLLQVLPLVPGSGVLVAGRGAVADARAGNLEGGGASSAGIDTVAEGLSADADAGALGAQIQIHTGQDFDGFTNAKTHSGYLRFVMI